MKDFKKGDVTVGTGTQNMSDVSEIKLPQLHVIEAQQWELIGLVK